MFWLVYSLFFLTTALHNFFNPSLRNLVYSDYELLIYFPYFMHVTASSLQSPASNCCCSHRHVQDQTLQLPVSVVWITFFPSFTMEQCPSVFVPSFWPHFFFFTVPVCQFSKFWVLISLYSPHLLPYTHWIIQFSADHLPPLMSFPICCTMMLQFLLLPLSLQSSIPSCSEVGPISLGTALSSAFFPCLSVLTPSHTPPWTFLWLHPPSPYHHPFPLWFIMEPLCSYDHLSDLGYASWQHLHLFFDSSVFFIGVCPLDWNAWAVKATGTWTRLCAGLLQLVYSPNE